MLQAFYFYHLNKKKAQSLLGDSGSPAPFALLCKLLKTAYFAILANSLQINVII